MLQHSEYEGIHYWQTARNYLGKNLYVTGFYLVDDLLIDCGPTNALPILKNLFQDLPIQKVVITHHHEDHTGNLKYLLENKRMPVFSHPLAGEGMRIVSEHIPMYRNIVWGRPDYAPMETIGNEVSTQKNLFQVIETPGHSMDHICFFDPERKWLFTGDLYLSSYMRYLRSDENIYQIMQSLKKLIDLKPKVLFCNHRGPVENAVPALQKKYSFLEKLRDEVLDCVRKGESFDRVYRNFKSDLAYRWFSAGELCTANLIHAFADQVSVQP
ncbi:MAG TPA: MBL fold metallo-hydrolase [Acidobacteriota bacterium]|nr:MBL fold metallo-hydrolase [Acidobacteriota bacterium]